MVKNKNLRAAKAAKKDEFYTQISDIANELKHYKSFFKGKIVFCNCDDPYESNFFKFFALKFNDWGLKKLICTCYDGSQISGRELSLFDDVPEKSKKIAYKIEISEVKDINGDGAVDLHDVELFLQENPPERLNGNGDFRSKECIDLLKQSDIVVTNPPFSLFREYVAQLINNNKKFLIIGPQNAITYREIFTYIRDNKLWLGYGFKGGAAHFISYYKDTAVAGDHKEGMIRVPGVNWFTNIDTNIRHETLDLYKKYTPEEYPKYYNFDAINVDKTSDIPIDYEGIIGVPITFMNKYCPEQFDIIGLGIANLGLECGVLPYKPEHKKYRKEVQKRGAVDGDLYMFNDGVVDVPYARILIRKKNNHENNITHN